MTKTHIQIILMALVGENQVAELAGETVTIEVITYGENYHENHFFMGGIEYEIKKVYEAWEETVIALSIMYRDQRVEVFTDLLTEKGLLEGISFPS